MPKITPEITNEAYEIYKGLEQNIKKGEWVSRAIIEKHDRETGSNADIQQMRQEIDELKGRVKALEDKMGRK